MEFKSSKKYLDLFSDFSNFFSNFPDFSEFLGGLRGIFSSEQTLEFKYVAK